MCAAPLDDIAARFELMRADVIGRTQSAFLPPPTIMPAYVAGAPVSDAPILLAARRRVPRALADAKPYRAAALRIGKLAHLLFARM
jgi:hypothetical protein